MRTHLSLFKNAGRLMLATLMLLTGQVARAYDADGSPSAKPMVMAIGNTVFQDYNRNGNLDSGEPGFNNVTVRLFQSGIQRGITTTDASGQYSFTNANVSVGIKPNTAYEIRITAADFPTGFNLTNSSTGGGPGNDAQLIGNNAVVSLTTDGTGNSTATYGIGFAAGNPDLVITTSATSSSVVKGNNATFTIQVNNTGTGTATSVVVSTTLDPGLTYVSSTPTAASSTTTANGTVLTWNAGTITAGAPTTNFSIVTNTTKEGVLYNTAAVTTADTENNPSNNISRGCITVPIKFCPNDKFAVNLPVDYTNVQWFKNGTPIASGNSFTIVSSGSYSFTTTANTSCPTGGCCPIIVEDAINPNLAITPASPAICFGQSTSLTVAGCSNGDLLWSNGATTANILVSPTATTVYSVTCTSNTYGYCNATASATVTVNPLPIATLTSATICNGTSTTLTASGGSSYRFSDGTTVTTNTTGLLPVAPTTNGSNPYSVTVTTALGCTAVASGSVFVNPAVVATLSSATICNGTSTTLTATGGTSYRFSDGTTVTTNSTGLLPVAPTTNGSNPYSVTVTSQFGCVGTASGSVFVNPAVVATLSSATICNGTSTTLTATGGTSYRFSDGTTVTTNSTGLLPVAPTTNGSNPYSVTVTSQFGCVGTATGSVFVNPAVVATLSSATICNGTSTTLTATGGTSYRFSDGTTVTTNSTGLLPVAPTTNGSNPYSVTVTSQFGCVGTASGSVFVNPAVVATLSSATICNGTSTTLTATGGTSYRFSDGTTVTTNSTGLLPVAPTTNGSNPYSVTVTSQFGCVGTASGSVFVNPAVVATLSSATICNGTSTTLTATGGTSYRFSDGTTVTTNSTGLLPVAPTTNGSNPYSVTVTSQFGCVGTATGSVFVNPAVVATLSSATICNGTSTTLTATGGTSYRFSDGTTVTTNSTGLLPVAPTTNGSNPYSVTVTTALGCTAVASGSVFVNPAVVATLSSATICNGTSTTLTATGGTSYRFSDGTTVTTNSTGLLPVAPTTNGSNPYSVTVTSQFGCVGTATGSVFVNPAVVATLSSATICNGTSTTLTATGGTSYRFSDGTTVTTNSTGLLPVAPTTNGSNPYSVTVTSQFGCVGTASGSVFVNPAVVATLSSATICNGTSTTLTATGGTSYRFSDGTTVTTNSTGLLPVAPTTNGSNPYSVTVTSQFGCVGTASGSVFVNPAVVATLSSATICNGTSTTLTATGGTSYRFSDGTTVTTNSTGLLPVAPTTNGSNPYSVTVTSQFGCVGTASGSVFVNPAVVATLSSATICNGTSTTLTATGGTSYRFSDGTTVTTNSTGLLPVAPTTNGSNPYSVTVTSGDGCVGTATGSVFVNPTPILTVQSPTIYQGQSTTLTMTGCAGTLAWSTGDNTTTLVVVPLQTTIYSATCTLGTCSASISSTVTVKPSPSYKASPVVATCSGAQPNNDGSIVLTDLVNVDKIGYAAGSTYGSGPNYAAATAVTGSTLTISGLTNPASAQVYTLRLYTDGGAYYIDVQVTLMPATCECPAPKCVPVIIQRVN